MITVIKKEVFFKLLEDGKVSGTDMAVLMAEVEGVRPEVIEELKNNNASSEEVLEELINISEELKFIEISKTNDSIVIDINDEYILEASETYSFAISEMVKLVISNMQVIKTIIVPKIKAFVSKWI